MKYILTIRDRNARPYEQEITVRTGARDAVLFRKAAEAMTALASAAGLLYGPVHRSFDVPNLWRNGGVGNLRLADDRGACYDVTIRTAGGCLIAR